MYLVVYFDVKGKTFNRMLKVNPFYEIGYMNHLGWTVIGLYYFYEGRFVDYNSFANSLLRKRYSKNNKENKLKRIIEIIKESK
ncbi:MAG TPA: hypothetical protein IAB58_02280 [Candidatus Pelethosoma merdigallinarum]|nr:hypothetical protein [Candidatus Pelethosoma merdigallinarum]